MYWKIKGWKDIICWFLRAFNWGLFLNEKIVKNMLFTLPVDYPHLSVFNYYVWKSWRLRHWHRFDYIRGVAYSQVTFLYSSWHEFRPHTSSRRYVHLIWGWMDWFSFLRWWYIVSECFHACRPPTIRRQMTLTGRVL